MGRRIALVGLIIGILAFFAWSMSTFSVKTRPEWERLTYSLEDVYQDLLEENWDSALVSWNELSGHWNSLYSRLDFVEDKMELFQFGTDLAELRGSILVHDQSAGLRLISELKSIWSGF